MNYLRNLINAYKFEIFSFIFIFFLIFAVYYHCVRFNFTHFDDDILILNRVQDMEKPSYAKTLFFHSVYEITNDKYYRPLLTLSFLADTLIGGGEPGFYHYSNILWHILAVLLVLICMKTAGYSGKISAAAAAIYAVHPALASAVAWIPGRNDSLLTVFSLMSFTFFIRSAKNGKLLSGILSGFFLLLALLTKETAVALPVMYVLYALLYKTKINKKTSLKLILCIALTLILYACLRHFVLSSGAKNMSMPEMLINLVKSLKATFWYSGIALLTEKTLVYPQLNALPVLKSLISISLISALCVFLRKHINFNRILFGIIWFVIFLIPTYVLFENIFLSHRLCLPMFGFFIVIFEILQAAYIKYPRIKKTLPVIFGILIVTMSFLSYKRTFFYQDKESFWTRALQEDPESPRVNYFVSSFYLKSNDLQKAQEHAFKALDNSEGINVIHSLIQIAYVYYRKGEFEQSESYYQKVIRMNKFTVSELGYLGLSKIYEKRNDKQGAIDILNDAAAIIPESKAIKKRLRELKENKKDITYTMRINIS